MSLLSDTALVPATAVSPDHPPIYLKLTPSLLASLLDAPKSGEPAMSLRIDADSSVASLKVGQATFEGSILKEPLGLDAYLPDRKGNFVGVGKVQDKISLRPKSTSPPASSNGSTKRSAEESRILHLLALGPNTPGGLANQSSMPLDTVKAVLAEWGVSKGADMYTIKPQAYEKLRIGEFKHYKTKDRQKVAQDALKAFGSLGIGSDHPAYKRASALVPSSAKKPVKRAKSKTPPLDEKPTEKPIEKAVKAEPKVEPKAETKVESKSEPEKADKKKATKINDKDDTKARPPTKAETKTETKTETGKRKLEARQVDARPDDKDKRIRHDDDKRLRLDDDKRLRHDDDKRLRPDDDKRIRPDDDQDPHTLARRFRQHYTEYLQLYSALSKRKTRPPLQVQKLLKMHRELEGWKQALWKRAGRSNKSVA